MNKRYVKNNITLSKPFVLRATFLVLKFLEIRGILILLLNFLCLKDKYEKLTTIAAIKHTAVVL